jgi:hypothetical protein
MRVLCREYETWCADNKLPYMPPDELSAELDYARDLTHDVRKIETRSHAKAHLPAGASTLDITRSQGVST